MTQGKFWSNFTLEIEMSNYHGYQKLHCYHDLDHILIPYPCCSLGRRLKLHRLLLDLGKVTNHVEGTLRDIVRLTTDNGFEVVDGVLDVYELARRAGENLCHKEGLGHEPLNFPGPVYRQLVVLAQLVHSQNCDDVLQ